MSTTRCHHTVEPLQILPESRWSELQHVFTTDFPRCVSGYTTLETQKKWSKLGIGHGFTVYCPFGDVRNGMVAINKKDACIQIIIHCPTDDTSNLELALRTTGVIDWSEDIEIPFTPQHIVNCLQRLHKTTDVQLETYPVEGYWIEKQDAFSKIISLPPDLTVDNLSVDYVNLIDSKWPYRNPDSSHYFKLLIDAKCGYGLFKKKQLVSWVFHDESGNLAHVFTLEDFRNQGYSGLLLKIVCNILLQSNKYLAAYTIKDNELAYKLFTKLGFKKFDDVAWCIVKKKCDR